MPRIKAAPIKGLKPGSAITRVVRDAADRLYDAYLRDPNPGKRHGKFDRAYSEFVRDTAKEFEKMAIKIYRRWSLPEAVEPQDVIQDLHVEIIRIMRSYKPEKATVAAYLIWNAFARAKKECNRQRGKVKDREPSLHALVISGLLSEGDGGMERFDDCIDRLACESDSIELDRECEAMLDSKKMLRRVCRKLDPIDAKRVRRVVRHNGNIQEAAHAMISASEEMDIETRNEIVARKAQKLMTALKNAANVWKVLERQERDGKEESKAKVTRNIARNIARNDSRSGDDGHAEHRKAVRGGGPQAGLRRTRKTGNTPERDGNRANRTALWALCA